MTGTIQLTNKYGFEVWVATITNTASGNVLNSATFFSREMARTWVLSNIKR